MKTGKTPYEIRLDLLFLASTILAEKHTVASLNMVEGSALPSAPTSEEILQEAEKLNGFVSQS